MAQPWWAKYETPEPAAGAKPAEPPKRAGAAPWWDKYETPEPAASEQQKSWMPTQETGAAIGAAMGNANAAREAAARPVVLSDLDFLNPGERANVISLAEKIRGQDGMALPGDATVIPGDTNAETGRFTSAVRTLETLRRSRAPQTPGDQFVREIGLGQRPAAEPAPVTPIDNPISQSFSGQIAQSVGGVAQAAGEKLDEMQRYATGRSALEPSVFGSAMQALENIGRDVGDTGNAMTQEAAASMAQRPEDIMRDPLGAARYYGEQALAGSGATVLGMGAGALNPALGAVVMGGMAGGSKYADARQEGRSVNDAFRSAGVAAAAELGPEKLSLDVAFGKLGKYLGNEAADRFTKTLTGRMAAAGVTEPTTEMATEALNIAWETYGENKPFDFQEAQRRVLDSGIIGGLTGVAMGGSAAAPGAAIDFARSRAQTARAEAEATGQRMREAVGSLLPSARLGDQHQVFEAARERAFSQPLAPGRVTMPAQATELPAPVQQDVQMRPSPLPFEPAKTPRATEISAAAETAPVVPFTPRAAPTYEEVDAQNAQIDQLLRDRNTQQPPPLRGPLREPSSPRAQADAEAIGLQTPPIDFYREPPKPPTILSSRAADGIDVEELDLSDEDRARYGFPPRSSTHAQDGRRWGEAPVAAKPDFLVVHPTERANLSGELADAFTEFAQSPDAMQLPRPAPELRTLAELTRAIDPQMRVETQRRPNGDILNIFTMRDGVTATLVEEPGGVLQLDAQALEEGKSGGAPLYAVVNTYAARNGLQARPDRHGLTEINKTRRTEHQAASALRTGSAQHLFPDITQAVEGFAEPGGDRENTGALIMKGVVNTLQAVPDIAFLRYNQSTGQIEWTDGTVATNADLDTLAETPAAREVGVGRSTIKRAVLGATWIRALRSGERGVVLGRASREQLQRMDAPPAGGRLQDRDFAATAQRALYSRQKGLTDGRQALEPGSADGNPDVAGSRDTVPVANPNVPDGGLQAPAAGGVDGSRGNPRGAVQPAFAAPTSADAAARRAPANAVPVGVSREELVAQIEWALGRKAATRLLGQKWMNVVATRQELPESIRNALEPGYYQGGVFLPSTSEVWLIANEITTDPAGVMLHEVGVHYGWRNVLGERGARLMQQFEALRGRDASVDAAFQAALDAGALPEYLVEEALGHYVEMNAASRDGLIARIIDAIREFVNRLGVPMGSISPEMLVSVARGAARQAAQQTPRNRSRGVTREERQGREGQGRNGQGRSPLLMQPAASQGAAAWYSRKAKDGRIRRTVAELVDAADSMDSWRDWYDRHDQTLRDVFGDDAELFQKLLSATSQAASVPANVGLALKAYRQLFSGEPFTGYLPAVIKNLGRVAENVALQGQKISEYGAASEGNAGAIAVDRHIAMLFFNTKSPNRKQVDSAKTRIRAIAERLGWQPREVQAALWAYNQTLLGTAPENVKSYDKLIEAARTKIDALRASIGRGGDRSAREAGSITSRNGSAERDAATGREQTGLDVSPAVLSSRTPKPFETSTKNAVTRAEIAASELLQKAAPGPAPIEEHQEVLDAALARVKADPELVNKTVKRLAAGTSRAITVADEAVLLVGKAELMLLRDQYADEALSDRVSQEDADAARRLYDETEAKLAEMNAATMASGREWGRFGAFRQRMLRQDFTLANLSRRAQIAKGGPLSAEELHRLKVDAERIAAKEKELAEAEKARDTVLATDEVRDTYVNIVKQLALEAKAQRRKKTPVRDYFTAMIEEAQAALMATPEVSKSKQAGAVISPTAAYHLTKLLVGKIGLTGVAVADWTAEHTKAVLDDVKAAFGARWGDFEGAAKESFGAALAAVEQMGALDKETSPEDTREEILSDLAKADGDIAELTHRDVYDLARAHILAGVRGENSVMAAVHADLTRVYPGITEREIRVLFSEYGKAVFPSKEADRVHLRELRALVQMQESIARLEEGKAPLRSGVQRDKPALLVREKRSKLNDMLKAAQAKDASPDRLATYQEMRERNLSNMLEEYRKQLATGERPVRRDPPEPTAKMKELKASIEKVRDQIRAIDEAGKVKESPEARALRLEESRLAVRLADLTALQAADWKREQATPAPKPTSATTTALGAKIKALEAEYATVLKARRPRRSKEERYNEARKKALLRRISDLNQELLTGLKPPKGVPVASNAEVQALAKVRDELLAKVEAQRRGPELTDDQKWEKKTTARLKTEMAKLQAVLAAPAVAPVKPKLREATKGIVRLRSEVKQAKVQIALRLFELEMAKRGPVGKFLSWTGQTLHLSRAIMTSFDLSAVLRQGGFIAMGHPIRAGKLFGRMIHGLVSQQAADKAMDDLKERPYWQYYEKAGLELTDLEGIDLTRLEEHFMSRWIQKLESVPGEPSKNLLRQTRNWITSPIRGSGRAFVTFLNLIRADTFDAMVSSLSKNARKPSLEEMKAVANYVNIATGRGKIGFTHKQALTGLNNVFFAPRLVASRFNLLFFQPLWGGEVGMKESGLRVRGLIAAEYARFLLGVGTALGLAWLAMGDDDDDEKGIVSLDPRNTDFLKVRYGDQFFDPLTGLAQVTVFATRMLAGESVTADGTAVPLRNADTLWRLSDLMGDDIGDVEFGKASAQDIVWRFMRTKLAPLPSAALNVISGSDVVGNPVTPADAALTMFMPISAGDIVKVWEKEGIEGGLPFTALSMLGVGTQYREPRDN